MKYVSAIIGLLLLAPVSQAALPQPDLIAKIHFAGAQKISADPHSNAFTNEFCSAEALALRTQTATKLSAWLAGFLQTNLNLAAPVPDGPAKLRPLFDDLQKFEWLLEARAPRDARPEVAVAIKLDAARAQLWQSNLKPFFPAASFKIAGGWLAFDSSPALKLGDRLAQEAANPPPGWLDLDINWPRLAQWHPLLKELVLPETQLTVTAPDAAFRINGKFLFPENLALNLEPWHLPTNTIHVPFNSFTAVRGIASWYQSQSWIAPFELSPPPNELFIWSLPAFPYQTYAAAPVANAAKALAQIHSELTPVIADGNARDAFALPVRMELTNNEITFPTMPFAAPFLRALTEPAGQFLFMGMFVHTTQRKPVLPSQLYRRLATRDLVFYHWEITSTRMSQILSLSQFGLMYTRHKQLEAESAAFKWLEKTGSVLTNTDTEITLSGPAEFTFTRMAPGLFTAPEFYTLANWLEATNFPGCDLKLPPRRNRQQQFHLTPVAPPGH